MIEHLRSLSELLWLRETVEFRIDEHDVLVVSQIGCRSCATAAAAQTPSAFERVVLLLNSSGSRASGVLGVLKVVALSFDLLSQ